MNSYLDQILPSLESFGLWSYWIIGVASLLEAFFATGVFVPGSLIVDLGGILVQQGALDFFDLIWFVAIGSILGAEAGYWIGVFARRGLVARWQPESFASYGRAVALFQRHGGFALVLGRFLGPVSGLVPFAASVAGMPRRRFVFWNILSGFPYAIAHVTFGFLVGDVASSFGPLVTRLGLFMVAVLVLLAVLWWMVVRLARLMPFAISILKSVGQAILDNADVRQWAHDHPRTAAFLARRVDHSSFSGLTATLLSLAALYIFSIWVGSVFDFLMLAPIVQADDRLANLIHAFWSPGLLRVAAHLTGIGDWKVVALIALAAVAVTLGRRRLDLLLGLAVALAGDLVSVMVLKKIFDRPRPDLAYFAEISGSFPSGHAAISVAFYGFLFFMVWRLKILRVVPAAVGAVTLAFLVGLSRIYLIEHHLSDVLNGWLVGAIWLIIGVTVAEWWRAARPRPDHADLPRRTRAAAFALIALAAMAAIWQVAVYDKARNIARDPVGDVTITVMDNVFGSGRLPVETESIAGTALEPINMIVLTQDEMAFSAAMALAGWKRAQDPGVASLLRAAFANWTNTADDTAPVTPYFWRSVPNDLAFQKPTRDATLRRRHHVRFWRTEFVTARGQRLFLGAASFDDGLDWGLLHHIDPNIDAERDSLAEDLRQTGKVASVTTLRVSQPRLGQSVAGDPWFTDGEATVIEFR
ncbi:MAG: LssY C-terminal domain-containing protein [Pseudorhodobacter sp.]|nr:LssY C-terminal domain-containing protein [Pseudorhodobacter sp.]